MCKKKTAPKQLSTRKIWVCNFAQNFSVCFCLHLCFKPRPRPYSFILHPNHIQGTASLIDAWLAASSPWCSNHPTIIKHHRLWMSVLNMIWSWDGYIIYEYDRDMDMMWLDLIEFWSIPLTLRLVSIEGRVWVVEHRAHLSRFQMAKQIHRCTWSQFCVAKRIFATNDVKLHKNYKNCRWSLIFALCFLPTFSNEFCRHDSHQQNQPRSLSAEVPFSPASPGVLSRQPMGYGPDLSQFVSTVIFCCLFLQAAGRRFLNSC